MQKSKVSIRSIKPAPVTAVVSVTPTPPTQNPQPQFEDNSWKRKLFNEKTYMLLGIIFSILALSFSMWSIHKNSVAMKRIESMNSSLADIIVDAKKPQSQTIQVPKPQPETPVEKLRKRLETKKEAVTKPPKKIDPSEYGLSQPAPKNSNVQSSEVADLIQKTRLEGMELRNLANNPKYMKDIEIIKSYGTVDLKSLINQPTRELDDISLDKFGEFAGVIKTKIMELPGVHKAKVEEIFEDKPANDKPFTQAPNMLPSNNLHKDIPSNEQDILFSLSQINKNNEEMDIDKDELERDLKLLLASSSLESTRT